MHRLKDIAVALDGALVGDGMLEIARATEPVLAGASDLAVALTRDFIEDLSDGEAVAALLPEGTDVGALGLQGAILVPRGRLAMARLTQKLDQHGDTPAVIHPTAVLGENVDLGDGVSIGPYAVIKDGTLIGSNTRIGAHVTIGPNARIGEDAQIFDGCRIGNNCRIGARTVLQPNCVIGGDGFSFVTSTPAHVEIARRTLGDAPPPALPDPTWHKIHSLGGVEIGDDVEVGANSTVDAGTLRPTHIGQGTKIDSQVQVGHNAVIGDFCLLCAQVGVAGSATIGDRTVLGGKSGIADNTSIGADVVIGGGSIVLSNVTDGRVMLGYPAVKMQSQIDSYRALRRLPRFMARLGRSETGSKSSDD